MACQSQNKILGPAFERDGFWYEPFIDCECTISGNCECNEIERLTAGPPKSVCSGTISGRVKDAKTGSPLPGAVQLICENGGECMGAPGPSDSTGFYRLVGECPSTSYEITCSAEGYKQSTQEVVTDNNGNAQWEFSLEPDCQGTISGRVLDFKNNNQPIEDANLLICQNGKCFDPVVTDSKGQYTLKGFCPSSDFDITCSAEGYRNQETTGTTDLEGNSKNQDILMESESTLQDTRFEGTLYRGNAPMGFTVYYFKVDKVLGGQDIPIGDPVGVSVYDSSVLSGQGGSADTLQEGDKAEIYARIYADKGKHDDGYEIAWSASITEDKKYYVKNIESVNGLPKLISLSPDRPSPQEPGSSITWNAVAKDPDNDPLSYRFELKRPSSNDYVVVKNWSPDDTWTWIPGLSDLNIGDITSLIRAKVRDSKHRDQDDQISQNYSIKMKIPDHPEYDELRILDYGNSYKAIFIKNREIIINVNKYSNNKDGFSADIYQIISPTDAFMRLDFGKILFEEGAQEGLKKLAEYGASIIKVSTSIVGNVFYIVDAYNLIEIAKDVKEKRQLFIESTSTDETRYKIAIPEKRAEFAKNRQLQRQGQSSIVGSFLESEVLKDLKDSTSLNWVDVSDIEIALVTDGEMQVKKIDNEMEFKYEPLDTSKSITDNQKTHSSATIAFRYNPAQYDLINDKVFAKSLKNCLTNMGFEAKMESDSDRKGLLITQSDFVVDLRGPTISRYIDMNSETVIRDDKEFKILRYQKNGNPRLAYVIQIKDDVHLSEAQRRNAMEHAVEYFISNIGSLYNL